MKTAQAHEEAGSWTLPPNDVWNVPPPGTNEVRFVLEVGPAPHFTVKTLQGLVFGYKDGKIYGIRRARELRQDGLATFGRVSIGHKKVPCFTGSRMFKRADGSLCEVAVIFI